MFHLIPRFKAKEDVFTQLARSFDSAFNDDFFAPFNGGLQAIRSDIRETAESVVIEAELPGFHKDEIDIQYDQPYLTIQAVHSEERREENKDQQVLRSERRYGAYSRRYYVDSINEDAISASLKDGVLTLVLPKQEKAKRNRIVIED